MKNVKIGDYVVCKDFPWSDFIVTEDPNITIGNSYRVIEISNIQPSTGATLYQSESLCMLEIIGNTGDICHYWSDYFYSKKETRKLKLEKIKC